MSKIGFLGLDLGGTGVKAGLFGPGGELFGFSQQAFTPRVTERGAEIDIEQIYQAARLATLQAAQNKSVRVAALATSSQGQTFVSLDEQDHPLHPAILWYDSRADQEAEELRSVLRGLGEKRLADGVEAISTASKILWLRKRYPDLMSRAKRFVLLPDFLSYRLTGIAATDPSTASSTGLYVEEEERYHPSGLKASAIGEDQLGIVHSPGSAIGCLRPSLAEEWGLPRDCLVVSGTNDQYAGALGAGNCRPGIVSETTGTCLAAVTITEKAPRDLPPGLFFGRFPIPGCHFLLAYCKTAGLLLDWYRREFSPSLRLADLDELAAAISMGSEGLTVLPNFDGAVSPVPNDRVRGAVLNLTLGHGKGHLYRAILEALTFNLRENLALLRASGFPIGTIRSIGGGAKSEFWLQLKADILQEPIEKPTVSEAAVLGAALLAAVGRGEYSSIRDAVEQFVRIDRVFPPNHALSEAANSAFLRYQEFRARLYPH